jgi:hypothetical protein
LEQGKRGTSELPVDVRDRLEINRSRENSGRPDPEIQFRASPETAGAAG